MLCFRQYIAGNSGPSRCVKHVTQEGPELLKGNSLNLVHVTPGAVGKLEPTIASPPQQSER